MSIYSFISRNDPQPRKACSVSCIQLHSSALPTSGLHDKTIDLQITSNNPVHNQQESVPQDTVPVPEAVLSESWTMQILATIGQSSLPLTCLEASVVFVVTEQVKDDGKQRLSALLVCLAKKNQILVSQCYSIIH